MKATELRKLIQEIERTRKVLGWSQSAAAERLGIPLASYRRWLSGASAPSRLALDFVESRVVGSLVKELRRLSKQLEETLEQIESFKKKGR